MMPRNCLCPPIHQPLGHSIFTSSASINNIQDGRPKNPSPAGLNPSPAHFPQSVCHRQITNNFQAEKAAATASKGFSFFGGRTEKLENAADLYTQAANAFKVQSQGPEAGQAFEKAAAIQRQLNEPDDAANSLVEAFKSYKRQDPQNAARCLEQAIKHYTSRGSFRRAATHQQNLAELWELDLGDYKKAIEAYDIAGDWFMGDNAEA